MTETDSKQGAESQLSELYRDLKRTRKEAALWKNKYNQAVGKKQPSESATNQESVASIQPPISAESAKTHTYKPWQAACVECGEKNPEFKDETKCANCQGKLGTVEVARKLNNCPHCGEKAKFSAVTAEAREKIAAMVKQ